MQKKEILNMISTEKDPEIDPLAGLVLQDESLLAELIKGLRSKKETYRYNCLKILDKIGTDESRRLYEYWDVFVDQLRSSNAYHRMTGIILLADLAYVDKERRFEIIFDDYFGLLDDEKVIVACYVGRYAWKIAEGEPQLCEKVVEALLGIVHTHHVEDRKALVSADIIPSLGRIYETSSNKKKIMGFVEGQLEASSPKARKAAKAFLRQHSE